MNSEKYNDQFYDFDEAASIAPSDVDIRKYYKGMYIKSFLLMLSVTRQSYLWSGVNISHILVVSA